MYIQGGGLVQAQVKAWGNSQGIRISKEILKAANIAVDDMLDVRVAEGSIILEKQVRHKSLEERAAKYANQLYLDGEYDWGEPTGREGW